MKRLYIGIGLLVAILAVGIFLTGAFSALHDPLAKKMDQAAAAAMAENWDDAAKMAAQAQADWARIRNFTAAVADHEPLEEVDSLFAQLEVLVCAKDAKEFAMVCARLSTLATALARSQSVTWWNLL